jgi:hypothetical protein
LGAGEKSHDYRDNLAGLVLWESRSVPRTSDAVRIGSVFLCMVPDGPLVDSKWFSDECQWDQKIMFRSQDPAGARTLLAKGQTHIERVVPIWPLEELGVLAEHFEVWERSPDLVPLIKMKLLNESIGKGNPKAAPDLPPDLQEDPENRIIACYAPCIRLAENG